MKNSWFGFVKHDDGEWTILGPFNATEAAVDAAAKAILFVSDVYGVVEAKDRDEAKELAVVQSRPPFPFARQPRRFGS